ncbi:MAG: hypothetical protein ABI876_03320, partial [Bacteroidota bacterium]
GPSPDYDKYTISYFDSDILTDSLYRAYGASLDIDKWSSHTYEESDYNIREWSEFFGKGVPDSDIYRVIYGYGPGMLDSVRGAIVGEKGMAVPDSIAGNRLIRLLVERRDALSLGYILYAKHCEQYASLGDGWEEPRGRDTAAMRGLITTGIAGHDRAASDFLRLRYAFQAVRMAHYAGWLQEAIDLYDRLVAPGGFRSLIRYRALALKAGALKQLGRVPEGLYLFSRVFDSCDDCRGLTLLDFDYPGPGTRDSLYALTRDDHERATIAMMEGLAGARLGLESLREMRRYEPRSPRLEIMMMRQVHAVEENIYRLEATRPALVGRKEGLAFALERNVPIREREVEHPETGPEYLAALHRFIMDGATGGGVHQPALWYLAAGYLDLMDSRFDSSEVNLQEALRLGSGNPDIVHQARLLRFLDRLKKGGSIDETLRTDFPAELEWLRVKEMRRNSSKYQKAMTALAQRYLAQDDVPRAILAMDIANDAVSRNVLLDFYATNDDLSRLEEIISAPGTVPLDTMLVRRSSLDRNALLDLRGTRLLRDGKIDEALRAFQALPDSYWSAPDSTAPLYLRFQSDFARGRWRADERQYQAMPDTFNKLTFTRTLAELETEAREHPERADSCCMRIANGFFNTPFWGYAGTIWRGDLTFSLNYYYGANEYPFNIPAVARRMHDAEAQFLREYGPRELARRYYEQAIAATHNRELAAECWYLIDICRKAPMTSLQKQRGSGNQDRTGYRKLKSVYKDTRFYRDIIRECGTYRYFRQRG